jgi:hypothetical protein
MKSMRSILFCFAKLRVSRNSHFCNRSKRNRTPPRRRSPALTPSVSFAVNLGANSRVLDEVRKESFIQQLNTPICPECKTLSRRVRTILIR